MSLDFEAVLRASRDLQRARNLSELLVAARAAVVGSTRYRNVWIAAFETADQERFARVLAIAGPAEPLVYARCPRFPVAGDTMLHEILEGRKPVVVLDARTDPRTNKDVVAQHQNRTILNVPLILGEDVIGSLGAGSFGDEGCVPPTPDELEMLTVFAVQLAPAFDRVRLLEREREATAEREALRQRLHQVQRVETIGLLAGGVAHDFNNLLTVILNCLCFLSEEATLTEQSQQDLRDATEAANRARDVTRRLLAMGRKQPLRLARTNWGERIRDFHRLMVRLLPESVEVVLEEAPDLPPVVADSTQLDQVLMNLSLNARDAMPAGGRLTIRLRPATLAGAPAVALEVSDTGAGMAPDVLERVFEPFFTTKGVGAGTGLGLPVAQGIVAQHGGVLECRSQPGAGTTFTVTLPAAPAESLPTSGLEVRPSLTGTERILAAEDDPAIRDLVQRVLSEAGYRVTVVPDGQAAVAAARQEAFDLVLLDAVMPRLTGRDAWEAIHQLQPRAAWLFMSGYAADTLSATFLAAQGIELLEKPWLPAQLLSAVRRALGEVAPSALAS